MIALDTNVLVRFLVQDDPDQARIANTLFDELTDANPGFVSREVLVELVWVLERAYGYARPDPADGQKAGRACDIGGRLEQVRILPQGLRLIEIDPVLGPACRAFVRVIFKRHYKDLCITRNISKCPARRQRRAAPACPPAGASKVAKCCEVKHYSIVAPVAPS